MLLPSDSSSSVETISLLLVRTLIKIRAVFVKYLIRGQMFKVFFFSAVSILVHGFFILLVT